jgi:penicillin-binding protein 2
VGVRKIYETIFGVKGNTVVPGLALFPSGNSPTKLPRISPATKPKPSILNPGQPIATPSAAPAKKVGAKR